MRVAVIGAGVAGLVTAYRLSQRGHACDVYERWPGLGGQAATLDVGRGHLLERYYHHLFTSDRHVIDLYEEIGLPDEVEWLPSSVGMLSGGRVHPFTTPLDLLRFEPLSPLSRVRMGLAVLYLQRRYPDEAPFDHVSVRGWVERAMGRQVWEKVWGPLMHAKFGDVADDVTMAWLWRKLTLRRQIEGREAREELLGYPRHSWETLFERLRDAVEGAGGRVLIDRPAVRLRAGDGRLEVQPGGEGSFRRGLDPSAFEPAGEPERYDGVVATVPSDVFLELLDPGLAGAIGDGYLERVSGARYQTALCLLLELDRRFHDFYWTNVADPTVPFIGLIEHTNFISPERYGGRRFLYVANYLDAGDPLLELDADGLLARYEPALRTVTPDFSRDWVVDRWLHREPAAQPVPTVGYADRIPPLDTGVPGLVLANTTQIYPEDRGTNYSVRLGTQAADALEASLARRS
ncbi:MAG TPA: NAD(P)/FAD-dependent oxidoreductase [Thermoleophilaceae bacterium]|nr:NAD(P)/FAD-dependent oxidoreductase [Thermoleophilaceae bacterium]